MNGKNEFLGKKATDKVTGYTGTIAAYCEYLHGEPQVRVDNIDKTDRPIDLWLPLSQVNILDA